MFFLISLLFVCFSCPYICTQSSLFSSTQREMATTGLVTQHKVLQSGCKIECTTESTTCKAGECSSHDHCTMITVIQPSGNPGIFGHIPELLPTSQRCYPHQPANTANSVGLREEKYKKTKCWHLWLHLVHNGPGGGKSRDFVWSTAGARLWLLHSLISHCHRHALEHV